MGVIIFFRINKVLRELNISLERAVNYLNDIGIFIESNPNTKITENEYQILKRQFENKKIPKLILELENQLGIILYEIENIKEIGGFERKNLYLLDDNENVIGLNLNKNGIIDISPLEKFKDLTSLSLSVNQISDITPIHKLRNLVELDLTLNNIGNYSVISNFSKLETLKIADNTISDFSFFPTSLSSLSLTNCEIRDLSFLLKLNNLSNLDLSYNLITDISSIKNYSSLKYLGLSRNSITDISSIKNYTTLEDLDLNNNKIVDINSLKNLKTLLNLDLGSNSINNINSLKEFTYFENLNLSENHIFDISSLELVEITENLFLGKNDIIDLTPLYHSLKDGKINFINVFENPLLYPPMEIAQRGEFEIWDWFEKNLDAARNRIKYNKEKRESTLDIGNCGLTDLSLLPELFEETEYLEELIISNHYARYNHNGEYWDKIERIGIYPNNISVIPNSIKKLENLKVLIIGGDWKKGDAWNRWRIKSISNLLQLQNLEVLNISNNQVNIINNLSKLSKLKILHANNNNIKVITPLGKFESLEEIYLSNNNLIEVDFLKDLTAVKTIDLHGNKIKDISPIISIIDRVGISENKWNINTISINNNPLDDILINLIKISDKEKRTEELTNYFERLKDGDTIIVKRIKLILLGNTRVGKTTLADILSGTNKANGDSTHGINFFNFKVKDIEIKGYDFGGQDYYHNTHHSFFDDKSLYLLVWGNGQKDILSINNNKEILFPLNYWLSSLNKYAFKYSLVKFFENIQNLSKLNSIDKLELCFDPYKTRVLF